VSSVSNGLYFLTLPLVSVMRVIYRKISYARYLYIKRNVEKVWGACYTLGARCLSKNTVICALSWSFTKTIRMFPAFGLVIVRKMNICAARL
jgi:hypothetical protein